MKQLSIIFFLVFQLVNHSSYAQVTHYLWGDTVDNFTVTDTDGKVHTLYDYTAQGKYVMIDFFFVACGPCKSLAPIYNEFYDKYGCNQGEIICLSIDHFDNDAQVIAYENTYGGSFHHAPACSAKEGGGDPVVANFGVNAFPTMCLINPENKIILLDIYPRNNVEDLENAAFINGFNPEPMSCSSGVETELFNNVNFNIYPNPAQNYITVNLKEKEESAQLSIFNLVGEEIFAKNSVSTGNKVFVDLKQGVYFVKITTKSGTGIKKLLIE